MLANPEGDYIELKEMHSPKKMLQIINKKSEYSALPRIEKKGLRDCQYNAEINLEQTFKSGKRKALAVLATGSGKTYLACLAAYRLSNYTPAKRVLFLVDRNNLARQTETEFSLFDRTEKADTMNNIYQINRLKSVKDANGDIVISTIQKLFAVLTGQTIVDDDEDKEDEKTFSFNDTEKEQKQIELGENLKLSPDHFQFIIIRYTHQATARVFYGLRTYYQDRLTDIYTYILEYAGSEYDEDGGNLTPMSPAVPVGIIDNSRKLPHIAAVFNFFYFSVFVPA